MDKYQVGDRFLMRIDSVEYEHKCGKDYSFYVIKPEPSPSYPEDDRTEESVRVSEDFLDRSHNFGLIGTSEYVHVTTMKPCPFCGCSMILRRLQMMNKCTIRYEPFGHHKRGCALDYAGYTGWPQSIGAAVKKWNRRAQ